MPVRTKFFPNWRCENVELFVIFSNLLCLVWLFWNQRVFMAFADEATDRYFFIFLRAINYVFVNCFWRFCNPQNVSATNVLAGTVGLKYVSGSRLMRTTIIGHELLFNSVLFFVLTVVEEDGDFFMVRTAWKVVADRDIWDLFCTPCHWSNVTS